MSSEIIPFPKKKYNIILADPPWEYADKARAGKRGVEYKYSCMSIEDIQSLPIYKIVEKDSLLFLWVTFPLLKDGLKTIEEWGFNYITCGFNWIKTNKDGSVFKGMGHYSRANSELCLIGKRGKGVERIDKSVEQPIIYRRKKHSSKPIEVRERIDRLYGDVPKIELFARSRGEGWDATGLDLDGKYIKAFLEE